jgi:hypothetical protein
MTRPLRELVITIWNRSLLNATLAFDGHTARDLHAALDPGHRYLALR